MRSCANAIDKGEALVRASASRTCFRCFFLWKFGGVFRGLLFVEKNRSTSVLAFLDTLTFLFYRGFVRAIFFFSVLFSRVCQFGFYRFSVSSTEYQNPRNRSRNHQICKHIILGFGYLPISEIFYCVLFFGDSRQIPITRNPGYALLNGAR